MADDTKPAKAAAAQPPAEAPAPHPKEVQLLRPFGFIDEARRERSWKAGEIVRDPAEIGLLVTRGAMFAVLKA